MPEAMSETLRLTLFTLGIAAAATAWILPPGVALGWALSRRGWRGRAAVEALVSLPLVLPPTAVGLALLLLLGRDGLLGGPLHRWLGIEVAFTWKAVVVASGVVAFPLLVRSVRSALEEVDPRLLGVARTLGRGPAGAFFAVHLPLAWRGVLAGTVLAFARALGEFGATVLVAGNIPGRTQTLALAIFQRVQVGRDREAVVLAGVSALLAFAAMVAVEWLTRRREKTLER
jgi:molybdate transport system permease protein